MGENVGEIYLDLVVNNRIAEQLDFISKNSGKSISDIFDKASNSAAKSFSADALNKSVEAAAQTAAKNMEKTFEKAAENIEDRITFKGFDEKISKNPVKIPVETVMVNPKNMGPSADAMKSFNGGYGGFGTENNANGPSAPPPKAFTASADAAELLKQKIENINTQIGITTEKLQSMLDVQQKLAESGADESDFAKLDDQILSAESRLISLQQSLLSTKSKLDKIPESGAKTEKAIEKTASKISAIPDAAKKASNQTRKHFDGLHKSVSRMGKRIKNVLLSAFVFSTLYAGFRVLKEKLGEVLGQNKEFSKALNDVKANLLTAFAPILNVIMPALTKLMQGLAAVSKYVAAFIAGLFGQTYAQASDAAKKLQDITKEKKKLQTTGIDEMTILSKNDEKQESSIDFNVDDSGTSKITDFVDTAKGVLSEFKSYLSEKFAPSFDAIGQSFDKLKPHVQNAGQTIGGTIRKMQEDLAPVGSYIANEFVPGVVNSFNENLVPIFTDVLGFTIDQFATDFEWVGSRIATVLNDLQPAFELFQTMFSDMCTTLKGVWDEYGESILTKLAKVRDGIKEIWDKTYGKILKPIWDIIVEHVSKFWEEHGKPLFEKIVEFFAKVGECVMTVWNNFLQPLVSFLIDVFGPVIKNVFNAVMGVVDTVFGVIADVIGGILDALGGLLDFITGVFSGNWNKAWEGIKNFFKGIWDAIWGIVKGVVNLIIDGINLLWTGIYTVVSVIVNAIGGIAGAIGDLFGQDWHFSMPEEPPLIPKLAKGGIVNQPTLAMIGESGKEAVVPLENNTGWIDKLASLIAEKSGGTNTTGEIKIQIDLDGRTLKEVVVDLINQETSQTGVSPLLG